MKRIFLMFTILASGSCFAQSNDNDNANWNDNNTGNQPCVNAPLSLSGDTREVTVGNGMAPAVTKDKTYVYYHVKGHRKFDRGAEFAGIPDPRGSRPILVSSVKNAQAMPDQSYSINLSTPDDHVRVCPDSTVNLTATIDVQQDNEYTGNYPAANDVQNYKLVSKHVYRKTERKMRSAERKERRVARLTKSHVSSSTSVPM